MPINKEALERVRTAKFTAENFVEIMEHMCATRDALGGGDTQFSLDYQSADTVIEPGDMIPVITIGLREPVVSERIEGEVECG